MNSKLKPIPELDDLSNDKREQLHHWIEELGYHKAIEKLRSELGIEITYNKLYRYYQRVLQKDRLESGEDDQLTMPDYLALLNGEPIPYDRAGIETVMKRAFDRSCARQLKTSELASLLRIFHYKKNSEWNDRRLAQNDKRIEISSRLADLRRDELTWRQSKNPNLTHARNPNPPLQEDDLGPFASDLEGVRRRARAKFGFRKEDALGPLARNLDDVERRACAQFNLPYNGPSHTPSVAEPPGSLECGGSTPLSTPCELPGASEPVNSEPPSEAPSPAPSQPSTPNTQPPSNPQPGVRTAPSPSTTPSRRRRQESHESNPPIPETSANSQPKLPAPSSALQAISLPQFVQIAPAPPARPAATAAELDLERRVNDYTLARHHEFLAGRSETKHRHCPCGHQEVPCPEHGEFENDFWGAKPEHSAYMETLESKGLPYTSPKHIIEQRERTARKEAGLARLRQEDPDGSKLRERAKLYAIRRFRTTDGPKYGGFIPDDPIWKSQCPCGASLPCDPHEGLSDELRYIHPLNSDYQRALSREGIPLFVPAALFPQEKPKADANSSPQPGA